MLMIERKTKRTYKKITPREVALHEATEVMTGNASAAVREMYGDDYETDGAIYQRAYRIVSKRDDDDALSYIDKQLEQSGIEAIQRISEMVHSGDERIATKNAHYIVDHIKGKAISKSISITGKLNIQSVLD